MEKVTVYVPTEKIVGRYCRWGRDVDISLTTLARGWYDILGFDGDRVLLASNLSVNAWGNRPKRFQSSSKHLYWCSEKDIGKLLKTGYYKKWR